MKKFLRENLTIAFGLGLPLLLTTVIAMLAFIGYYSAEHFANSLGWPVTLVLIGGAFLGVGTVAIKVKKRI